MSMTEPDLRLLTVHAHPDDEASKGAALGGALPRRGRPRSTLVCCTGGEEGDILNPAMDRPEIRERLADGAHGGARGVGRRSSATTSSTCSATATRACPTREANADPRNFANAPIDEAVGRLVEIIRRDRPQVIITYSDDQAGLPAPRPPAGARHLASWPSSAPAIGRLVSRAGRAVDAAEALLLGLVAGPGAGQPREDARAGHRVALRRGLVRTARAQDDRITTHVDIGEHLEARSEALLAHATQVDPTSPFWFALPAGAVARGRIRTTTTSSPRPGSSRRSPRTTSSPASAGPDPLSDPPALHRPCAGYPSCHDRARRAPGLRRGRPGADRQLRRPRHEPVDERRGVRGVAHRDGDERVVDGAVPVGAARGAGVPG